MTTINAILPYFGGKRTLASSIIAEFGPHRSYWEPFCGSMAVLMAKNRSSMETVCDLYGDVTNLAFVLQDERRAVWLYGQLQRTLLSDGLFAESKSVLAHERNKGGEWDGEISEVRAYHFFVVSWMGRNGVVGSRSYNDHFCVRYTQNGGHGATRFRNAVESIPAWHERLRTVTVLRADAFDVLERIEDAPGTVIYCDPPYIEKGAKYVHDFNDPVDHDRLASLLRRFTKARVLVSYYLHDRLETLYPGWHRRVWNVSKALGHQGKRGKATSRAIEVLLMNGPSLVEESNVLEFPA